MHRRSFLLSLFAVSSTSAVVVAIGNGNASPLANGAQLLAKDAPAEFPIENVQYWRRRPRQVCTWRRDRFGRRIRICRWV